MENIIKHLHYIKNIRKNNNFNKNINKTSKNHTFSTPSLPPPKTPILEASRKTTKNTTFYQKRSPK